MQKMRMLPCAVAILLASGSQLALKAADEAPPAKAPDRPELREQLKNLTPEERAAKIKEFREQRRDELQKLSAAHYVSSYELAAIYVALGEREQAFQRLERAYKERSFHLINLKVRPDFAPLRSDPRFQELVRRIGLPQ